MARRLAGMNPVVITVIIIGGLVIVGLLVMGWVPSAWLQGRRPPPSSGFTSTSSSPRGPCSPGLTCEDYQDYGSVCKNDRGGIVDYKPGAMCDYSRAKQPGDPCRFGFACSEETSRGGFPVTKCTKLGLSWVQGDTYFVGGQKCDGTRPSRG